MRLVINGNPIIGIDRHIAKAIVESMCESCMHHTTAHYETGCTIEFCTCKKGYTSYQLLQDEEFVAELIKEGLLF